LSIHQLVAWGVLYYSFAVYLPQMEAELGWSGTLLSGGFSVGLVTSGLAAPFVGRHIDRRGSRELITVGAAVGVVGMILWASARSVPVFFAAWALIGLAMSATLYEPAFATVVRHYPDKSRQAIVRITLAGGLASTVFSPLAQLVSGGLVSGGDSWRSGVLILTVVFVLVTVPLGRLLPPDTSASAIVRTTTIAGTTAKTIAKTADVASTTNEEVAETNESSAEAHSEPPDAAIKLWPLALVFALSRGAAVGFNVHIISLLIDKGQGPAIAALIAGLAGVAKVAGRVVLAAGSRWEVRSMLEVTLVVQAVFLQLGFVSGRTALAVLMVVVFGATAGAQTVLRPLLITETVGTAIFGSVSGSLQLVVTIVQAAAPLATAVAIAALGFDWTWLLLGGVAMASAASTRLVR
jgi:hypothetical protein